MTVTLRKVVLLPLKIKICSIAGIGLLILLVGYIFTIKAKFENLQMLQQKNVMLALTLTQQRLALKKIMSEKKISAQVIQEHPMLASFNLSQSWAELLTKLIHVNQSSAINAQSIVPQELKKIKYLSQQKVQLVLTSNYDHFRQWLQALGTISFLVIPAEFVIKPNATDLLINVTLLIYGPAQ